MTSWQVKVGSSTTTATLDAAHLGAPMGHDPPVFVCGHGAGGHMNDPSQLALARALVERGLRVVRFNFLYAERGLRRPDRMPLVRECFAAVVDAVRKELAPSTLIIGGRSMGGRAASLLAADGFACDALLLYAYPLHPAGETAKDKRRDAHLPQLARVPVCCFNGTRDELCTPSIMKRVLRKVARAGVRWEQHWLDGADHSFHVLKSSGTTDADVVAGVADASLAFVRALERERE